MEYNVELAFKKLKGYCEQNDFKGWDPYDGLNSRVFQSLPIKKWDIARLFWIQFFKRSPINLRKLACVPKGYNAKGIALFLSGYCNLYHISKFQNNKYGTSEEIDQRILQLADLLLSLQNKKYSGSCWGYNFDWQARRLFLFPKNTPNVVTTSFAVEALLKAYKITKHTRLLDACISASEFVLNDLNRTKYKSGFLFSYAPLKGNNTVFNASLLGAKILSQVYPYTKNDRLKVTAKKTIYACCEAQSEDGSWRYGMLPVQKWIDSFHTGYNLEAIQTYQECTGDLTFQSYINKGLKFYLKFFRSNGKPMYYHNKTYPIDIHCPGQMFVTLTKLNALKTHESLVQKVMQWTIKNMQDKKKGYFYYQRRIGISSKISYMRWSNAFMFNAMSYYLLLQEINKGMTFLDLKRHNYFMTGLTNV